MSEAKPRPLTDAIIDWNLNHMQYVTPGLWDTWAGFGWPFDWNEQLKEFVDTGNKICWPLVRKGSLTNPVTPTDIRGAMAESTDQRFCAEAKEFFEQALKEVKVSRVILKRVQIENKGV